MKERLLKVLNEEFSDIDFMGDGLVDNGVLDSLTLVGVISVLTQEFEKNIPYEEIIPDNFNSVDAMVAMLERLS